MAAAATTASGDAKLRTRDGSAKQLWYGNKKDDWAGVKAHSHGARNRVFGPLAPRPFFDRFAARRRDPLCCPVLKTGRNAVNMPMVGPTKFGD